MLPFVCFSLSFSFFFCREITIRSIHDVKQQIVLLIAYWKQVWKTKTKNKIVACVSFVVVVVGCKAYSDSVQNSHWIRVHVGNWSVTSMHKLLINGNYPSPLPSACTSSKNFSPHPKKKDSGPITEKCSLFSPRNPPLTGSG